MASNKFPALARRPVFTPVQVIAQETKKETPAPKLVLPIVHAVNYVPVVAAGKPIAVVVPVVQPVVFINQPRMVVIDPLVRLAPHLVRF